MDWGKITIDILDWAGRISIAVVILATIRRLWLWLRGIVPLSIRVGQIRQHKVAIFASSENFNELLNSLDTTKLFNKDNFKHISTIGDLDSSEGMNIFIVRWEDWKEDYKEILDKKTSKTGLIVYSTSRIDDDDMKELQRHSFVTLTNFRGRLITDLLSLATTISYAKDKN